MASQTLFDKAVGTKKDFFKSYIEVKEVKDYVDEDSDTYSDMAKDSAVHVAPHCSSAISAWTLNEYSKS
eukprot:3847-Heterococcus_DN1.PRE.4